MQLGSFRQDPKTGGYIGAVKTLTATIDPVRIVPRTKVDDAPKGVPDFDVVGPTGSDFGAAWSQKRESDGIEYLSLRLYDPSFNNGETLRPALWPRKDGSLVLIHEPMETLIDAANPAPAQPSALNGSGRRRAKAQPTAT